MINIIVSDMMCPHCVARIEKGFHEKRIEVQVNLATKSVSVAKGDYEQSIQLLKTLGYHPKDSI